MYNSTSVYPDSMQDIQSAVAYATPDASGEVRINCINPNCSGGQKKTLGINVDTGAFHCFRCDLRGNYLKKNGYEKQPMPEWLYDQATPSATHPYIEDKQINPLDIRVDRHGNWVVPFKGSDGKIKTVQFISPEGDKRFLSKSKGGQFKGSAYVIQGTTNTVYYCEGPATGHSIHESCGAITYCCGGKDNLDAVMEWAVKRYPDSRHIVAADNDKSGDGYRVAESAAKKHRALIVCPGSTGDFNDFAIDAGLGAAKAVLENPRKPDQDSEKNTTPKFRLIRLSDVEIKPADWQTDGFMEMDSLNLLFSDPGGAKTFLAIDQACCTATGKDFHGRPVRQGPVVYIAGEGQNGLKRRFMAWGIRNGFDTDHAPIFLSMIPAGLCDHDQVGFVIEAIEAVANQEGDPVLIVLDTVARNFGPGDENSTKDMSGFIAGVDKIRERFRSCVLLVHHSGHADKSRGRGSMALKGALDTEYRLEKDEMGVIRVTNTKMKDHVPPEPMAFRLTTIELPFKDDKGRPVTSAVLDNTEYVPPASPGKKGRGKWQTISIEILKKLYQEHRDNLESSGYDTDQARVLLDDWRTACIDEGMNREAWRRIKDGLKHNPDASQDGIYVLLRR